MIRTSLINLSSIMIWVQICHSKYFRFFLKKSLTFLTSTLATRGRLNGQIRHETDVKTKTGNL